MSYDQSEMQKKGIQQYSSKEASEICRECIQTALIRLMKTKELNEISITELTKTAGVSRTTYYRNYYNKEDVLQDLFSGLMKEIATEILASKTVYDTALAVFTGIRRNAEVYQILLKAHYTKAMLEEITRIASSDIPEDQPLEQMRIVFLTGALFNMVCMWLDTGMRQTPEQMADIYMEILGEPIRPGDLHGEPADAGLQHCLPAAAEDKPGTVKD